ncbi:MAG: branched-chain amino acid ABC transporter substrate-binding protein [Actinobacteria bacterium]|nr:branched-chain amino acid ABC transporter substrate-binding protein [Actinomycetota bacterium]
MTAKKSVLVALGLLVASLALVAAGCGGGDDGGGVAALPAASCADVEYGGEGDPDVLIASDLPLQGGDRVQTLQMQDAIRFVLEQRGWKAGDLNVAYQGCDDSTAQTAAWDSGKCNENGQNYAANEDLAGLIGTFNSGCAEIIIPLLNQAEGGAIPMVSPANTKVCLTTSVPSCSGTEPDKYYPSGERNYGRVVALNDAQAATIATFAKEDLGIKSVYIINDKQAYGLGLATNLESSFKFLEVEVLGNDGWDPKASSYEAIFNKVKASGAEAVVLSGLVTLNGVKLLKDKVAVLGPNSGVKLLAPDGFTPFTEVDKAGSAVTEDMYVTVAGSSADALVAEGGAGREFINAFKAETGVGRVEPYTAYAAQAAQVLLDAIAAAGNDRAATIDNILGAEIDGILGQFTINEEGDVSSGAITVYGGPEWKDVKVITPAVELVTAAGGG